MKVPYFSLDKGNGDRLLKRDWLRAEAGGNSERRTYSAEVQTVASTPFHRLNVGRELTEFLFNIHEKCLYLSVTTFLLSSPLADGVREV